VSDFGNYANEKGCFGGVLGIGVGQLGLNLPWKGRGGGRNSGAASEVGMERSGMSRSKAQRALLKLG
jgi:hypothetical protein